MSAEAGPAMAAPAGILPRAALPRSPVADRFDLRAGKRLLLATAVAGLLALALCTAFYFLEVERLTARQLASLGHHLGQLVSAADTALQNEAGMTAAAAASTTPSCMPSPEAPAGWHFDEATRTLYHEHCVASGRKGSVVRLAMNDARLATMVRADLRLFLLHDGKVRANSLGAAGGGEAAAIDAGNGGRSSHSERIVRGGTLFVQAAIRWDDSPTSPLLVGQQRLALPFSLGEIAGAGLVLWATLAATIWMSVGLWLGKAMRQIQFLAYHDTLTGLINRAALHVGLPHMLAENRRSGRMLAVFFLDLDHFKTINDSLGHAVGDRVLAEVASRLTRTVRDTDFVARIGGDEFVLVLGELRDAKDAASIARKVIDELSRPVTVDGQSIAIGTSVGIATHPGSADAAETLVKQADCAMYAAKSLGRGRYHFYDASLGAEAERRFRLEQQMRAALVDGAFELHYQAVVSGKDGHALSGFEALIRWRHEGRNIPPAEFIPIAEENGLIAPLGEWVLNTACRQLAQWQRDYPASAGLNMSVNVSVNQLKAGNFVEQVAAAIDDSGIAPQRLILELTESLYVGMHTSVPETLRRLRALGVRLAMDDFGTGYSSLAQLTRLPLDRIKIDREFVANILNTPNDLAIAQAIIAIGHRLGLEIVAEGIETPEQAALLVENGCSLLQGWLFAAPATAGDIARHLGGTAGLVGTPCRTDQRQADIA